MHTPSAFSVVICTAALTNPLTNNSRFAASAIGWYTGLSPLVTLANGMKTFFFQASNTFMRSLFAATLPLVVEPLFNNLGVGWACTLLGCISIFLA
jgi:hypothetical protein